jgi:hypothetical protein
MRLRTHSLCAAQSMLHTGILVARSLVLLWAEKLVIIALRKISQALLSTASQMVSSLERSGGEQA